MYFDRFDIVQAHRLFYTLYHEGQWSDGYRKLSKIDSYYTPGLTDMWGTPEDLNDNARAIYDNLVAKFEEADKWLERVQARIVD